jgi:hypothetical protein
MHNQYLAALHAEIQKNAQRRLAFASSQQVVEQKAAWVEWVEGWEANFDLDVCWHVPREMRVAQDGYGHEWLQKQLSAYFKQVELQIFQSIPVRQRPKLERFVVLEFEDGVGWHAHALIATPEQCKKADLEEILRTTWERRVGLFCRDEFKSKLFWIRKAGPGYLGYCLKSAVDVGYNDQSKGVFDYKNTVRK